MFPLSSIAKSVLCKGKVTPVRKLKQSCSEGDAAATRGFMDLPNELKMRIVEIACHPVATRTANDDASSSSNTPAASASLPSPSILDIPTALNLALVSREIYSEVISILYTNIAITKPSALIRLQHTLAARPALGRIVRSLHIGPPKGSSDFWEPMINNFAMSGRGLVNQLFCSLSGPEAEALLPIWCDPDRRWTLENGLYPQDCQEAAVFDAIRVAGWALNVNPCDQWHDIAGVEIGIDAWTVKTMELQAALDLYLMEMRRVEERKGYDLKSWRSQEAKAEAVVPRISRHKGKCNAYPRLAFVTPSMSTAATGGGAYDTAREVFRITLAQVHEHLARPGASTDTFDHPLLFARSGVRAFLTGGPGRGLEEWEEGGDPYGLVRGWDGSPTYNENLCAEDFADIWDGRGLRGKKSKDVKIPPDLCDEVDPAFPAAATLGSLLASARMVLSAVPCLEVLSLTGFLERAVCGSRSAATLKALRSLSFGPPPPFWYAPMRLDHPSIASVEELRIAGSFLFKSEIAAIAGHGGALPKLKKLEWVLSGKHDWWEHISLLRTVQHLLRRPLKIHSPAKPAWSDEEDEDDDYEEDEDLSEDDEGSSQEGASKRPPRVLPGSVAFHVALDASDIADLLAAAPTPGVRADWAEGRPAPHRLILSESRAAKEPRGDESIWIGTPKSTRVLYEDGRQWWEDHSADLWRWS